MAARTVLDAGGSVGREGAGVAFAIASGAADAASAGSGDAVLSVFETGISSDPAETVSEGTAFSEGSDLKVLQVTIMSTTAKAVQQILRKVFM
ncbi:hypothetical protein ACFLU6_02820 [Acidobacteriota bacterium]